MIKTIGSWKSLLDPDNIGNAAYELFIKKMEGQVEGINTNTFAREEFRRLHIPIFSCSVLTFGEYLELNNLKKKIIKNNESMTNDIVRFIYGDSNAEIGDNFDKLLSVCGLNDHEINRATYLASKQLTMTNIISQDNDPIKDKDEDSYRVYVSEDFKMYYQGKSDVSELIQDTKGMIGENSPIYLKMIYKNNFGNCILNHLPSDLKNSPTELVKYTKIEKILAAYHAYTGTHSVEEPISGTSLDYPVSMYFFNKVDDEFIPDNHSVLYRSHLANYKKVVNFYLFKTMQQFKESKEKISKYKAIPTSEESMFYAYLTSTVNGNLLDVNNDKIRVPLEITNSDTPILIINGVFCNYIQREEDVEHDYIKDIYASIPIAYIPLYYDEEGFLDSVLQEPDIVETTKDRIREDRDKCEYGKILQDMIDFKLPLYYEDIVNIDKLGYLLLNHNLYDLITQR